MNTTSLFAGTSSVTFLRLCSRAPVTTISFADGTYANCTEANRRSPRFSWMRAPRGIRVRWMPNTRCRGCNALVPDIEGPVHKYVSSAPGCWKVFGEVQADESLRFRHPPEHRLVVDAYMAQHPGDAQDRRDRQSVFVHLVALCALSTVDTTRRSNAGARPGGALPARLSRPTPPLEPRSRHRPPHGWRSRPR